MTPPVPPQTVLIIGGGEMGLSLAYELAVGPYKTTPHLVTLLDRSATPPSLDAASSDHNKIVRSDYSDLHYASLAREAIEKWQTPLWSTHYAACGTVIMSSASHPVGSSYVAKALALNQSPAFLVDGVGAVELNGAKEFRERYSGGEETKGEFEGMVGYFNGNCGYTTARSAMDSLCLRVREAGVTFRAEEVTQLVYEGKGDERDVIGVLTREGEVVRGDLVVLAAGGWSASLLPELGHELLATGQVVGTIQLETDEIEAYQGPVTFCLDTGFYVFPPTKDGIVKFAIHGPGFLNPSSTVPSVPRTSHTSGCELDQIPRQAVKLLKEGLARIHPGLVERKWEGSRLCWYCDSPSSDWLIDYHPKHPSLFLATAGSGHAFKFLPIMGKLILGALQGTLPEDQREKWAWERLQVTTGDASRGGTPACRPLLKVEEMATREEM